MTFEANALAEAAKVGGLGGLSVIGAFLVFRLFASPALIKAFPSADRTRIVGFLFLALGIVGVTGLAAYVFVASQTERPVGGLNVGGSARVGGNASIGCTSRIGGNLDIGKDLQVDQNSKSNGCQ